MIYGRYSLHIFWQNDVRDLSGRQKSTCKLLNNFLILIFCFIASITANIFSDSFEFHFIRGGVLGSIFCRMGASFGKMQFSLFQPSNFLLMYSRTCMKRHRIKRSLCIMRSVAKIPNLFPLNYCFFTSVKQSSLVGATPLSWLVKTGSTVSTLFLNLYSPQFSYRQYPENVRTHSSYAIKNASPQ